MERHFQDFEEVVQRALRAGRIPEAAQIALLGRLSYAFERGDITDAELQHLERLMGADVRLRYADALEIAMFGDATEHAVPVALSDAA